MKCFSTILLCVAVMFAMASTAKAGFTPIGPSGDGPANQLDGYDGVLDRLYGWDNVTRISDYPEPGDQIWVDLDGNVTAVAKHAGYTHQLGYSVDEVGGTSIQWLNVTSEGTSDSFDLIGDTIFVWALHVNNTNLDMFSLQSLNDKPGGKQDSDQMVTYKITGNAGDDFTNNVIGNYVICWSDIIDYDNDFQDLVVEVHNAAPVPVPGAVLLGILGLGAAGLKLRKFA